MKHGPKTLIISIVVLIVFILATSGFVYLQSTSPAEKNDLIYNQVEFDNINYFVLDPDGDTFKTNIGDINISLSSHGVTLESQNSAAKLQFIDWTPSQPIGGQIATAKANFFLGKDAEQWFKDVPLYRQVTYESIYPGIDLTYSIKEGCLKSVFTLQPRADLDQVKISYEGIQSLSLNLREQTLSINLSNGKILQENKPYAYQIIDEQQKQVGIDYQIINSTTYGFKLTGEYDPNQPLIIDPELIYATYLGGSLQDEGWAITVDQLGNTLIAGITQSNNFPIAYPGQGSHAGDKDIFVIKFDSSGEIVYSTLIGGSVGEESNGIAVDSTGNAYVAGETFSPDFPVLNAWQPNFAGYEDAYVLKLTPQGNLAYSTFIGGTGAEEIDDIIVDATGMLYVAGEVYSDDYPLVNPWSTSVFGSDEEDGFISIFNVSGELVYSTYVSANKRDQIFRIAVDDNGYIYAAGMTSSSEFPTVGAIQPDYGGDWDDCFVFKLDPWTNQMIYSTFLGGSGRDECWGIAVDSEGSAYVTGFTRSPNFPLVNAFQSTRSGETDAFIAKINPQGNALDYSTLIGGNDIDQGWDLTIDSGRNIYITGETNSGDFPTFNALQPDYGGKTDGFLSVLDPDGNLAYSSFIGGTLWDQGWRLVADKDWVVHITGFTESHDLQLTNPFQNENGGMRDAFVAQFGIVLTPTPTPTPTPFATKNIGPNGGLMWMSYPSHLTMLSVPPGVVNTNTTFKLTYDNRADNQGELQGINHFFSLQFSQPNVQTPTLSSPLELILGFNERQGVIANTINLYHLQVSDWTTNDITITEMNDGHISALINKPGVYGLLGKTNRLFLPLTIKQRS